ncbi:MAG: YveK family protein, partial [Actinomycetes bacterium]
MDQVSGQQGAATLGEYGGAFRRRWWVVALGAVFGLALAAVYLLIVPKTYIATAAVKVEPIGGSADNAVTDARTNSGVNLDTEAQLVTSQAVSAEAKVALQSPEIVGQLVQHVSVSVPPNTNVLRISYSADTPEAARLGASAYANGYLKNRRDTAVDSLDTQERALKQQIEELQTQLDAATPEERDGIQTTLQAVRLRLGQVVGTPVEPGEIISDALLPRRPASPNAALVLASGLAFGLLIGLSGLYLLERRDGRCYDWRTVERRLGLAVLADIPGEPGEPAPLFEPHSMGAESFAELRNALMSGLGDDPATLVVATPSAGNGADVVAANLAVTLARSGHSTTIVIADEESAIPMLFGLPATEGL